MNNIVARGVALAAAAVAVAALSGCGSSAPAGSVSAGQVIAAMRTNMESATGVHIDGNLTSGSERIAMDMTFYGSQLEGTMAESSASFTVIVTGGTTYIKATPSFLSSAGVPASECSTICGKYLVVPATNASALTGVLNLKSLASKMFATVQWKSVEGAMLVPGTHDGQKVLEGGQGKDWLYVTASRPYYPLALTAAGDNLTFSDWNSTTAPTAPPSKDVVKS